MKPREQLERIDRRRTRLLAELGTFNGSLPSELQYANYVRLMATHGDEPLLVGDYEWYRNYQSLIHRELAAVELEAERCREQLRHEASESFLKRNMRFDPQRVIKVVLAVLATAGIGTGGFLTAQQPSLLTKSNETRIAVLEQQMVEIHTDVREIRDWVMQRIRAANSTAGEEYAWK